MTPIALRAEAVKAALSFVIVASSLDAQSHVHGTVRDSAGAPVAGSLIELSARGLVARRARSGTDGIYRIADVTPGSYTIRVVRLGFRPESAFVTLDTAPVKRDLVLVRAAVPLSEVVVSPGRFGVMGSAQVTAAQTLTREDIETTPQLGEDIYRVVTRLPGVSASDFSARFRVRNGGNDELLVLLDGLELYEPFHLKDFDGSLSVVDVAAVGGVDLLTGGFTAEYGDKTTGVFDITSSSRAPANARTSIGLSITNVRALSEGAFGDGRGQWLVAARRGYLDFVLKLVGEENPPDPTYYDLLGKLTWRLSPSHTIGARMLEARDNTFFRENDDLIDSGYGNRYGWVTLDSRFADGRVLARTMLSSGLLTWSRDGVDSVFTAPGIKAQGLSITDRRRMSLLGVQQNWTVNLQERTHVRLGGDVKRFTTDYDYLAWQLRDSVDGRGTFFRYRDSTNIVASPEGNELGAFASVRVRPLSSLALEAGARFDHQEWTDESAVSPRLAAAYDMPGGVTLRAAWGRYRQAQGIHELQVLDGDSLFHPSEVAEHRVAGVEWSSAQGVRLRAEAYDRRIASPRPRYVNLDMDIEVFGERSWDRAYLTPTSAQVRGLELFVQRDAGGAWSQSASYALAKATEDVNGVERPRMFDQRHTMQLESAYKPNEKWRFSAAWQFHSGWPISIPRFAEDTVRNAAGVATGRRARRWNGFINNERLPSYARLDLRATRRIRVRGGEMQIYADIFNALDRANVRGYDYNVFYQGNQLVVQRFEATSLPRLPTIGMAWEF